VIKRDGREVSFDRSRISHAIEMAFRAEAGVPYPDPISESVLQRITAITDSVVDSVQDSSEIEQDAVDVERIQDEVERQLMIAGAYGVARRYILYREARARARDEILLRLREQDGSDVVVHRVVVRSWIDDAASGQPAGTIDTKALEQDVLAMIHPGMTLADLDRAIVFAGRARIETHPAYNFVAARALLRSIYSEVAGRRVTVADAATIYPDALRGAISQGIRSELYAEELAAFDLERLANALMPERDLQFRYLGLQTLYDRYLIHEQGRRIELPQVFWMRVAMGLALAESPGERTGRAIEFYEILSTFRACSSSPTLFNAGTRHPQLSSCYLTTIGDDLESIFKGVRDNALLSKWSGGIGNDWTNVRSLGSHIKGTNGQSQGVIPFLKVVNDTAVAVNQGGKRKGAVCAYLEVWHADIEEFLDLRRNTGDDRRRTHDMNTAVWVPDLFMQRVQQDGTWTLFSPSDVPDLHDLYGRDFVARYEQYERLARQGAFPTSRSVRAVELWRQILSSLFETGHPWITFKDPSNIRSPQDHVGVVHSSNLCTEILLNTSPDDEVAVCNLASINLVSHIRNGRLDDEALGKTVSTVVRMLDNVIDINYYPIPEAATSNRRHRPVGLGIMGFQDALSEMRIPLASEAAVEFADTSMEQISWHAIMSSSALAAERGSYESYPGSKWDRGLLPIDSITLLSRERGQEVQVPLTSMLDWSPVRESVRAHGMRNSNVMAIAPTATIANIQGVSQSIEPLFSNLYVKSNLSGEFTVTNEYLVRELQDAGLWDASMVDELKYWDGSVQAIERIPEDIRERYPTAYEIDPSWLIACAARRQKWIDMGQSLNLYIANPNGKRLQDMYFNAWASGLKTTYYLRSRSATQAEKSTLDVNRFGIQPRWMTSTSPSADIMVERPESEPSPDLDDTICEACQ
jgi:ribonucleoside-diphosphate reductase alpha chain